MSETVRIRFFEELSRPAPDDHISYVVAVERETPSGWQVDTSVVVCNLHIKHDHLPSKGYEALGYKPELVQRLWPDVYDQIKDAL